MNESGSKQRRKSIPFRPQNCDPKYWQLLKSSVRDLSKIAMPAEFNEPLSMLQRQTEELEYAHLLDLAALENDPYRRLAFVCVFAISGYSTVGSRPTKPFNPIVGETFECDRKADRGWRSLAEQISHHPPGLAMHVEGQSWWMDQHYLVESKLNKTNICITPKGHTTVKFVDSESFTYGKLSTSTSLDLILNWSAKNGIKANTECVGEFAVASVKTGAKGLIIFHANKKGSHCRMVTGSIVDSEGKERYRIEAIWDKWARIARVDPTNGSTEEEEHVWTANELPMDSQRMHNFTQFAIELNEEEPGTAPTDSRRRPDQRLCEMGQFEAANRVKKALEEAQRVRLKELELHAKTHRPMWFLPKSERRFSIGKEKDLHKQVFTFTGDYWKAKEAQSWELCPELFAV